MSQGAMFIVYTYVNVKKNLRLVPPPRIAQSGPGAPNQGPYRPIRARIAQSGPGSPANEREAWRTSRSFEYQGGGGGGNVWVNPSSKCASCHSNEMHQRIIHTHVNVSSKAYVYDDTIYNFCARARFAGCTYLRNIILALNTVWYENHLIYGLGHEVWQDHEE